MLLAIAIRKAGKSAASVEQVRCPLTRFYQWQQNVHGYRDANPAAELKFIGKQPSKRARKRDLQWFLRPGRCSRPARRSSRAG